jgi:hypothetical protein
MAQHNRNNWHHIPGIGGIMATGLSIQPHSLPSFGFSLGWCDLAMCVAVKRWHFHFRILFLSFQVYNYQVLIMQQLAKALQLMCNF